MLYNKNKGRRVLWVYNFALLLFRYLVNFIMSVISIYLGQNSPLHSDQIGSLMKRSKFLFQSSYGEKIIGLLSYLSVSGGNKIFGTCAFIQWKENS